MINQLRHALTEHNPEYGLFVSTFDDQKNLIFSQGSRKEPANETLIFIYEQLIQNNTSIHTITLHIVTDIQHENNTELRTIDLSTTGIGIYDDEGDEGAILPNTTGIKNIQEALSALKSQSNLHGKAHLITFTTTDINFKKP